MEEHPEFLPLLTVAGGPMRGLSFRLGRERLVVGRAPTADVVVADPHLSRRHAELWLDPEGPSVLDLGSTNGTWLNDRRITGVERLADGDVIRIGRTELRVYDPGVARTDPVGLTFGLGRRDQRPTLPLPIASPERAVPAAAETTAPGHERALPAAVETTAPGHERALPAAAEPTSAEPVAAPADAVPA